MKQSRSWQILWSSLRIVAVIFISADPLYATSSLMEFDGGPGAKTTTSLNQGKIDYIEWGLSSSADTNALVISYWTSEVQTADPVSLGTDSFTPCDPVTVDEDDYIIGYTSFYDSSYIYGLALYTLQGTTFECYDEDTIAGKSSRTITSSEHYTDNANFYYLSGWIVYHQNMINGIQLQFTNIATVNPLVINLPNSSFSATSEYYSSDEGFWPAYRARYDDWGWSPMDYMTGDVLEIDFQRPVKIHSIGTKGVYLAYAYRDEYVTQYELSYSVSGVQWEFNQSMLLDANLDRDTEVLHAFDDDPLIARYLQFEVLAFKSWPVLRVEVYGYDYVTAQYQPIIPSATSTAEATSTPGEVALTAGSISLLVAGVVLTVICLFSGV